MLSLWLREHLVLVRLAVAVGGLVPLFWLVWAWQWDGLGANPLETLTTVTGLVSLNFLLASLLVTPLRRWLTRLAQWRRWRHGKRVADWNSLVKLRRQLGMWCFVWGLLHAAVFLEFDAAWSFELLHTSMFEKPYIAAGVLALLLLVPLAVTSPMAMMRRLGKNWLRLHRTVYVIAILVLLHYVWQARPGTHPYLLEALALSVLLGYRLGLKLGWLPSWSGQDGLEAPERN